MTKKVQSLTGGLVPIFAWRLPVEVASYKQPRLPAAQWVHVIKGLAQKGIKASEIDDSKVIAWLEEQGKTQLTREEVAEFVSFSLPAIKEMQLSGSSTKYRQYSWAAHGEDYNESIFYFPTVVEDFTDRIADLDEAISALNFDFDRLGSDPDLIFRLDRKREELFAKQKEVLSGGGPAFYTHFGSTLTEICPDARADFAHMRWSVMNLNGQRTLFVHEMQSDWAQRGRASEWKGQYKKAPLVTETEYWTGFLLRRAMALAVETGCSRMTWINGSAMVNGGMATGAPGLDDFYLKIVPSIAKKLAKPFASELFLEDFHLRGNTEAKKLAVMPVNDKMKEGFIEKVPVYSYANVVGFATFDSIRAEQLRRALQNRSDRMFGPEQSMRVCVVREILHAYESQRPAGALIGRAAEIAFSAEDPVMALDHEAFHFAHRYHFTSRDREIVARQFAPGNPLLVRTIRMLMERGDLEAANQAASNPEEAAAHAFGLWRKGQLSLHKLQSEVADPEAKGMIAYLITRIFPAAEMFVTSVCRWIKGSSVSPSDFVARIVHIHDQVLERAAMESAANHTADDDQRSGVEPELAPSETIAAV